MNTALQNEIDPAATGIAPGLGSIIPTKDMKMNTHGNNTVGHKTPACCVTIDQIRSMSMEQRRAYYDALRLAETALGGIINQPRFIIERTFTSNPAGALVEDLHTFINETIDLLVKVTRAEAPVDPNEVEARGWLLLLYDAHCSDSLPDFVSIAAQHAAALAEAEFHAKHGGRRS